MGGGRLRPRSNILQPHPPPGAHPNTSVKENEDTHDDGGRGVGARAAVSDDEGAHRRGGDPSDEEDDRNFTEKRCELFVWGGGR